MRPSTRRRFTLGIQLAALAVAAPAVAQTRMPAVVHVRVTDATGAPIARAEVAILEARRPEAVAVATTDSTGRHTFSLRLDSASYRLTARKIGYLATIRRLLVSAGDTTTVELRLAAVEAVRQLPTVRTRATYRIDADPGDRDGFERRCAVGSVSCVREDYLAQRPSADLTNVLNHVPGVIPTISTPSHPSPPLMSGLFAGKCVPAFYVNGFRWGLGWADLETAYNAGGGLRHRGLRSRPAKAGTLRG